MRAHDAELGVLADRALDGIEEAVWHRGEQVGTRVRYDTRLLLAHLARLDKALEDERAVADAARFDELVAGLTGDFLVPGDLMGDADDLLPLTREHAAEQVGERADLAAEEAGGTEDDCVAAFREGLARGRERWDGWVEEACDYVDRLTGWNRPPPHPGLPGNPLPEPLGQALAVAARPCESPPRSFARTVCDTSTSALARSLAGPREGHAAGRWSPPAPRHVPRR